MALRLGELLVQQGALSQEKLDEMLQRQRAEHRRLGEILVSEGLLEADSLREALAQQDPRPASALSRRALASLHLALGSPGSRPLRCHMSKGMSAGLTHQSILKGRAVN